MSILQIGHLLNPLPQVTQEQRCPHGNITVLISASKQILHILASSIKLEFSPDDSPTFFSVSINSFQSIMEPEIELV